MALHGAERAAQAHRDYINTELMVLGERLNRMQDELADTRRRLAATERMVEKAIALGESVMW